MVYNIEGLRPAKPCLHEIFRRTSHYKVLQYECGLNSALAKPVAHVWDQRWAAGRIATMNSDQLGNKSKRDRLLALFLRIVGAADLLAIVAVFLPAEFLGWAHEAVGLGELPQGRIVGYLARSTSLLYGIHGAMLLVLASDVVRYHILIRWYGRVIAVAGLLLIGVDVAESMPVWWTVFEGVAVVGIGVVILTLCHEQPPDGDAQCDRPAS